MGIFNNLNAIRNFFGIGRESDLSLLYQEESKVLEKMQCCMGFRASEEQRADEDSRLVLLDLALLTAFLLKCQLLI